MATTTSAKREATAAAKSIKDDVVDGAADVAAEAKTAGRRIKRETGEIEASLTRSAEELAATVTSTLRSVGVDTDKMVDVAKEQATDLQRLIVQEIQDRPLRALGLAAAVGLFVGFLSAR
ncbi:DUF883 C-terminal domain-containing protein [Bosea sp. PAMC 26642]|uniref:DUF883 C-terminal domain-containing protein n=1 Tax=Bosea sp. (strain PAMC 26642) TaxID=1792307 RepID=UPI00076FE6BB|nr:DUF883 C-terminal domain-containing protein [Bosea sp. PAMC 26642]AMJ62535.1 hypothetical protein AXW83_21495 [Bosea sp. PAMC 26642]